MKTLLLGCLLAGSHVLFSQSSETRVMEVIHQLFHSMESHDGDLAVSLFIEGAELTTVYTGKDGETKTSATPAYRLAEVFSTSDQQQNEPIWNERIHMDGNYAVVWVEYAFYLNGSFSHCGVDVFQLVYVDASWKILGITDTRRKEGCKVPKSIRNKFHQR